MDGPTNDVTEPFPARIISMGSYVPDTTLTNVELSQRLDTSDDWIYERTGIRERRIAHPEEVASDMATQASLRALEMAELSADSLELIIVGTVSADQPLPSCAVHLQRKLGARCPAFDVSAACAGFLYALDIATRYVVTGRRRVLVVGVELLSRMLDWQERETCVLFGDGAGAAVIDRGVSPEEGVLATLLAADGSGADLLHVPPEQGVVRMRGREVFRRAVTELSAASKEVLAMAGLSASDVDHAVMHQANRRILESLARRTGIPWERFHLTIERYGNTSSASVPIGLDDAWRAGKISAGDVVLMAALGAGMSWGASVVRF